MTLSLDDGQRRDPRAGGTAQLGVGDDEQELGEAFAGDLGEAKVLDHDDAVMGVERLRNDKWLGWILGRHWPIAPRVAPGERNTVLDQPTGHGHARPGFALAIPDVVCPPQRAPAGVEEHRVAGPNIDTRRLDIRNGDHVAWPSRSTPRTAATSTSTARVTIC